MSEMDKKSVFSQNTAGCCQENVTLKNVSLFDRKMGIDIPIELEDMPNEMLEKYYPYDERPSIIKSSEDGSAHMTFQLFQKELSKQTISNVIEEIRKLMDQVYSLDWISNPHLFIWNEIYVGWFVFSIESNAEKMRHIKYVTSINKKFMLGTVTYPEEKSLKWESTIKYIFPSITDMSGNHW